MSSSHRKKNFQEVSSIHKFWVWRLTSPVKVLVRVQFPAAHVGANIVHERRLHDDVHFQDVVNISHPQIDVTENAVPPDRVAHHLCI